MAGTILLKACLNGTREPGEHLALPRSPDQLAAEAERAVAAGAAALHIHPRDERGGESLDPLACGRALSAIRRRCPQVPIGVTMGAWIEPDLRRRLALIAEWDVLPDFASVNFSEAGAPDLCARLLDREIKLEAGLISVEDARRFIESGFAGRCLRILIEPLQAEAAAAMATALAIEASLSEAGVRGRTLCHGFGPTAWPVLEASLRRGHDVRIGLEDTLELPDGQPARDNADLVAAARRWAESLGRQLEAPV